MPKSSPARIRCLRRRRESVEFNKLRKRLIRNVREAIEKFGMARPGEKWLVAHFGRQGQLRHAGAAARPQVARPAAGRTHRLQPRPGAAELSQAHPARMADGERHPASHRVPRHLLDRHQHAAGGRDLLLALLAAAARQPLSHRARGGLLGAGARPPSRGQPRDVLHEHVPWRPARRHAAAG